MAMIISFFSLSYSSWPKDCNLIIFVSDIISSFNLIFITPQSYFNYHAIVPLTHTLLKPVISSFNIVLGTTVKGNRCHNYAHITYFTPSVLEECQDLSMQRY